MIEAIPNLRRNMFDILSLSIMLVLGCLGISFFRLMKFLSILNLPKGFFFLNQEWVLDFIKYFLSIYWNYFFLLYSVNVINYIHWFSNIKLTMHSWNKLHLVMIHYSFPLSLGSILLTFCLGCLLQGLWEIFPCNTPFFLFL